MTITANLYDTIVSRSSAKKFSAQLPEHETIEAILRAAARAPDHGQLVPWRFLVLQGETRSVLAEAMRAALLQRMPDADLETQDREAGKALRSPVLIVVSTKFKEHPKVPQVEQLVAVGAAVQNLWLAASSFGLGVAWKTGNQAYSPLVKEALGIPQTEQIVGFIHLGYATALAPVRDVDLQAVTRWAP